MIRKNVASKNFKFWDFLLEKTSEVFTEGISQLSEGWKVEVHDKNLLQAVNDHGLWYLKMLSENSQYGFDGIIVSETNLFERVKKLCHHFKESLVAFGEHCTREGIYAADKSTGNTKIDLKRKFTKVNLERDQEGNVIYPIVIAPTLSILSLGVVEWERPAYHSEKNIFPIGFKSLRKGTSMTVPHK